MDNKIEYWFFYHLVSKKQMGPFPIDALCSLLINENIEINDILLCQTNWPKWKKALEIPPFVSHYLKQLNTKKDILPSPENFESDVLNQDDELPPMIPVDCKIIQNVEPELEFNKNQDKRKHPRVSIELKAVFITEKKSFRTRTMDVSLGGIKIIDPLPEIYCNQKIYVFLSSPDKKFSIKFEAELLRNTSSFTHLQFDTKSEIGLKHLEFWLTSLNNNIKECA